MAQPMSDAVSKDAKALRDWSKPGGFAVNPWHPNGHHIELHALLTSLLNEIDRLCAEVAALRKGPSVEELAQAIEFEITQAWGPHPGNSGESAHAAVERAAHAILRKLGRDA